MSPWDIIGWGVLLVAGLWVAWWPYTVVMGDEHDSDIPWQGDRFVPPLSTKPDQRQVQLIVRKR